MKVKILIAVYVVGIVATFGHAINNAAASDAAKSIAPFIAVAWPFYWSWELQRKAQP